MSYNTADIRQFLVEAFSDEELSTLCADYFRDVYEDLASECPRVKRFDSCSTIANTVVSSPICSRRFDGEAGAVRETLPASPQVQVPPEPSKPQRDPKQVFISTRIRTPSLPTGWPAICSSTTGVCGLRPRASVQAKSGLRRLNVA